MKLTKEEKKAAKLFALNIKERDVIINRLNIEFSKALEVLQRYPEAYFNPVKKCFMFRKSAVRL